MAKTLWVDVHAWVAGAVLGRIFLVAGAMFERIFKSLCLARSLMIMMIIVV